jgi:hypothetical protein
VNAHQEISSYWIRLHGLMDCRVKEVFQGAILRYSGAPEIEPVKDLTFQNTEHSGKVSRMINNERYRLTMLIFFPQSFASICVTLFILCKPFVYQRF